MDEWFLNPINSLEALAHNDLNNNLGAVGGQAPDAAGFATASAIRLLLTLGLTHLDTMNDLMDRAGRNLGRAERGIQRLEIVVPLCKRGHLSLRVEAGAAMHQVEPLRPPAQWKLVAAMRILISGNPTSTQEAERRGARLAGHISATNQHWGP